MKTIDIDKIVSKEIENIEDIDKTTGNESILEINDHKSEQPPPPSTEQKEQKPLSFETFDFSKYPEPVVKAFKELVSPDNKYV